jgi:hypothetical protein
MGVCVKNAAYVIGLLLWQIPLFELGVCKYPFTNFCLCSIQPGSWSHMSSYDHLHLLFIPMFPLLALCPNSLHGIFELYNVEIPPMPTFYNLC